MIRDFRAEDAAGVAAVLAETQPEYLNTERGVLHRFHHSPERAQNRWLVAEEDGAVVAYAESGLEWHLASGEVAGLWVGVSEQQRGRGLGSELYRLAEEHAVSLGVRRLKTWAVDERFPSKRGFEVTSREQLWEIDPRTFDAPSASPADLRSLGEVRDRAEELYEMYIAIESTMPREEQWTGYSFEEWRVDTLEFPDLDDETSIVALVDGRLAASALLLVAPDDSFAEVEVTGTLPEFRRRGLARACKVESMRRAGERGIPRLVTDNDVTNEPMLALNRSLGFQPRGTLFEFTKQVGG